jgi:SNF2 family DNA or RNA helicase
MKEDVEKSIAPKEETIIEVELTRIQKKYYKAIYEKNFEHLAAGRSRTFPSLSLSLSSSASQNEI